MFNKLYFRKSICLLLIVAIGNLSLVGCGGHNANPVDRYMMGDEKKSCKALNYEVANIDKEILLKEQSKSGRDTWNVIFFVTGFLVIVPWFFIDGKGSQEVEIEALKARKNALQALYHNQGCGGQNAVTTEKTTTGSNPETYQDYPVTSYHYDESSRKGTISVDISGKGIGARESVIENIGKICSDKGIALKYGEGTREGASYRVLNESVKDGILTIEFELVN